MRKKRNAVRSFLLWMRRWLRTSKPTEWITSAATFCGVIVAIVAWAIFVNNGAVDAKRSELEIKRTELALHKHKLQEDEKELAERDRKLRQDKVDLAKQEKEFAERERQLRQDKVNLAKQLKERDDLIDKVRKIADGTTPLVSSLESSMQGPTVHVDIPRDLTAQELEKGVVIPVKIWRAK